MSQEENARKHYEQEVANRSEQYKIAREAKQKARASARFIEAYEENQAAQAKADEVREQRLALVEAKIRRDEEIRKILLPFAEALKAGGWSIKVGSMTHFGNYNPLPVFVISKGDRDVAISYRKGVSFSGFEWD